MTGRTVALPTAVLLAVALGGCAGTADEVHVHGYDLSTPVPAGRPATTTFADVPGVFEVALHEAGTVLLTLQVG